MKTRSWLIALLCPLLCATARGEETEGEAPTLVVRAALVELPATPACEGRKLVKVTARYRVERVVRGAPALRPGAALHVVHRCPEFARGPSRYGNGKAPPLRPGHRHLLKLAPYEDGTASLVDRFPEAAGPRFRALRTDPAPEPPRIAVVVSGGAGASQRLDFDAEQVVVGRAADADILLSHPRVAPRHLLLEVREGETQVRARDLSGRGLRLDGKRVTGARAITAQDALGVGPYTIRVSFFTPEELGD
jgi:hypothetical protein